MADLRDGCVAAGLKNVTTYIQTGNVIFETRKSAAGAQRAVATVVRRCGLSNEVVLRTPDELAAIIAANPFPTAATGRPANLTVCFMAAPPPDDALAALQRHRGPERIAVVGRDLCVDYPRGVTGSTLAPGVIERRLAVMMTARNWNTARALLALAQERR